LNTENRNIVFFDAECGFCTFWVRWLIKRDENHVFYFASMHSQTAKQYGITNQDTLVLIYYRQTVFTKSRAVAVILSELSFFYRIVSVLIMLFPVCWADRVYSMIAAVRYRISKKTCSLYKKELYKPYILN